MSTAAPAKARISSLDQFRGYTVVGMILVNFVGGYVATHTLLKHHNTFFSYADTIMPQFFFAVGFALRLTFGRRAASDGLGRAYLHAVRRIAGLALVGIVLERVARVPNWQALVEMGPWGALREPVLRSWYGPLLHIALTSLWVLPVIRASATVRVAYMILSAVAQILLSHWFYFPWVHDHGTDGGPLGFLTWSIPTLVGTLACDWIVTADGRPRLARMFVWAAILMGLGYVFSCGTTLYNVPHEDRTALADQVYPPDAVIPSRERLAVGQLNWAEPPFVAPPERQERKHNYWMMSQRGDRFVPHVRSRILVSRLCAVLHRLRHRRLEPGTVSHVRLKRACGLYPARASGRGRRTVRAARCSAVVSDRRLPDLLRHHLPVRPAPGKERNLSQAVGPSRAGRILTTEARRYDE